MAMLSVNTKLLLSRIIVLFATVLFAVTCWAAKDFIMPIAQPAKTYPAHDDHLSEMVTIALDPYDQPEKTKVFSVDYKEIGFLPMFFVITNNSDQAISLSGMKAQFVTADRTKIPPATEEDIYRRLSRPSANTNPTPLPFPRKKVKGGVNKQAQDELNTSPFAAKAIEPHTTKAGFLFFDISGISAPLDGAHFYLTGVRDANGNELMYFEIPLEATGSTPAKR
jgi:hypothetical protein